MTRKADEANRLQLLERIVAYALANGVASLSLRPLAKQIGVSPASLLYHFHSRDELIVEVLKHAGDRQRELFASMDIPDDENPGAICREVWRVLSSPQARPLFRLFFEVYGLALIDPDRFPGFFPAAVSNWLTFLEQMYMRDDTNPNQARIRATIVLAGFRGFLLDVCATGDDQRVDQAVAQWIQTLS